MVPKAKSEAAMEGPFQMVWKVVLIPLYMEISEMNTPRANNGKYSSHLMVHAYLSKWFIRAFGDLKVTEICWISGRCIHHITTNEVCGRVRLYRLIACVCSITLHSSHVWEIIAVTLRGCLRNRNSPHSHMTEVSLQSITTHLPGTSAAVPWSSSTEGGSIYQGVHKAKWWWFLRKQSMIPTSETIYTCIDAANKPQITFITRSVYLCRDIWWLNLPIASQHVSKCPWFGRTWVLLDWSSGECIAHHSQEETNTESGLNQMFHDDWVFDQYLVESLRV